MCLGFVCFISASAYRIAEAAVCYCCAIDSLGNDNFELLLLFFLSFAFCFTNAWHPFYMSLIYVAVKWKYFYMGCFKWNLLLVPWKSIWNKYKHETHIEMLIFLFFLFANTIIIFLFLLGRHSNTNKWVCMTACFTVLHIIITSKRLFSALHRWTQPHSLPALCLPYIHAHTPPAIHAI